MELTLRILLVKIVGKTDEDVPTLNVLFQTYIVVAIVLVVWLELTTKK